MRVGRYILLVTTLATAATACDIPKDANHSLEDATGDTLHVGVTAAPPWVVREGEAAGGVEPELVRAFARSIDAEVAWHWGTVAEHMEALAVYDLDLVIGGLTRATPWRKHVGLTTPFHVTTIRVAGPPGSPVVTEESIDGRTVAVPPGGPIADYVRSEDGDPFPMEDLRAATGLVAGPAWELARIGRDTTGVILHEHRHVMAVPPGENGLLMALENALHTADVDALLARAAGGGR